MTMLAAVLLASSVCAAAPADIGITYTVWHRAGYADAQRELERLKAVGFRRVSFVPNYLYPDLNRVDFSIAPDWDEYERAVGAALKLGFAVVLMPHLEPAQDHGVDPFVRENRSWRLGVGWRGYFDVDPMSEDYRDKLIGRTLTLLERVYKEQPAASSLTLDLGAELMNSETYLPERWEALGAWARKELSRRGLAGKVLLSHNFAHHLMIPNDVVGRMPPEKRAALGRYVAGLDAVSISQYMDLTAAMPEAERSRRLPTPREVAAALDLHEKGLREEILGKALGLKPAQIPPLYIGEFAVCCGGLTHPNLYDCPAAKRRPDIAREVLLGHQGLVEYLTHPRGPGARAAVLWTAGGAEDPFAKRDSPSPNRATEEFLTAALRGR